MTESDRPADAPPGPTPEEISARLEALLKRTHALRARQASEPPPSLHITWPPPDRELDHYDIVDVPEDDRMQDPTAAPPAAAAAVPAAPPAAPTDAAPASPARPDMFARPDWSELRLRPAADEPARMSRGYLALLMLLALATAGQAAYIWTTRPSGTLAEGRLRVDGPEGATVRVDGQPIGPAPIDHILAPGDYDIDVVSGATTTRAERVSIGVGRTVVLLAAGAPIAAPAPSGTGAPPSLPASPAVSRAPGPSSVTAASASRSEPTTSNPAATAPAAVSPTRGGVLIESTPSGLPVTMEGRERGVTPITIGQLKPGRHDVLVGGLARKVDVTAGAVTTLRVARR